MSELPPDVWRIIRSYLNRSTAIRIPEIKRNLRELRKYYPFELRAIYQNYSLDKLVYRNDLRGLIYLIKQFSGQFNELSEIHVAILVAIDRDNLAALKILTETGLPIENFPYIVHALDKSLDLIDYLLEAGSTLPRLHNLTSVLETLPIDITKLFIKHNIELPDLLMNAVINNNLSRVKDLVIAGIALDPEALVEAAKNGHLEILDYLVERGLDPSYALRVIINNRNWRMFRYLIKLGANLDAALGLMIDFNNLTMIKYLIAKGARLTMDISLLGNAKIRKYLENNYKK